MRYLLDTCVISDFFKKIPSVKERFESISPERIHISSITFMEVEYGIRLNVERGRKIQPLWIDLLKRIEVIPYSPQCAVASAFIRAGLKNKGLPIGHYDVLIAGTSLAHNFTMVTSNMGEFKRIPELTIENWRQ